MGGTDIRKTAFTERLNHQPDNILFKGYYFDMFYPAQYLVTQG